MGIEIRPAAGTAQNPPVFSPPYRFSAGVGEDAGVDAAVVRARFPLLERCTTGIFLLLITVVCAWMVVCFFSGELGFESLPDRKRARGTLVLVLSPLLLFILVFIDLYCCILPFFFGRRWFLSLDSGGLLWRRFYRPVVEAASFGGDGVRVCGAARDLVFSWRYVRDVVVYGRLVCVYFHDYGNFPPDLIVDSSGMGDAEFAAFEAFVAEKVQKARDEMPLPPSYDPPLPEDECRHRRRRNSEEFTRGLGQSFFLPAMYFAAVAAAFFFMATLFPLVSGTSEDVPRDLALLLLFLFLTVAIFVIALGRGVSYMYRSRPRDGRRFWIRHLKRRPKGCGRAEAGGGVEPGDAGGSGASPSDGADEGVEGKAGADFARSSEKWKPTADTVYFT